MNGKHIACLLTTTFYILFPELIKAGLVYIIKPPLYGITIKDKFIPIYDNETRKEYSDKGYVVRRFKGLGKYLPK